MDGRTRPHNGVGSLGAKMTRLKRYFSSERLWALSAVTGLALLGYIYAFRVAYAYNERCMSEGQAEGDPFFYGLFFFPLLMPIALMMRGKGGLMAISMLAIGIGVLELPLDIMKPDIATGCFGVWGDHEDQTGSFQAWAIFILIGTTLVYGVVIIDWLAFALLSLLRPVLKRRQRREP